MKIIRIDWMILYPQMEEITRKAREVYGNHDHSCS